MEAKRQKDPLNFPATLWVFAVELKHLRELKIVAGSDFMSESTEG